MTNKFSFRSGDKLRPLLLILIAIVLADQARFLFFYPVPDTGMWFGDEKWTMLTVRALARTGIARVPEALRFLARAFEWIGEWQYLGLRVDLRSSRRNLFCHCKPCSDRTHNYACSIVLDAICDLQIIQTAWRIARCFFDRRICACDFKRILFFEPLGKARCAHRPGGTVVFVLTCLDI